MKKQINRHKSFILYASIGGTGALLQFISFSLIFHFVKPHYQIAYALSYMISVSYHFTLNRRITFQAHHFAMSSQLVRYLMMIATCYAVTSTIMHISVEIFKLSSYIGAINSMGVSILISYTLSRFWVFQKPSEFSSLA